MKTSFLEKENLVYYCCMHVSVLLRNKADMLTETVLFFEKES